MTTLPSTKTEMTAAIPEEIRKALRPLFAQFPAGDGDAEGKLLGYVIALEGSPKWSIDAAVRRFLRGEIASHDGRFLPTSAELAIAVRDETDHARRMAENHAKYGNRKPVIRTWDFVFSDWRKSFPSPQEFASWKLPPGSIITAKDATVTFPDGSVRTWTECEKAPREAA